MRRGRRSSFSCESVAVQTGLTKKIVHFKEGLEFVKLDWCRHISASLDMLDFSKSFEQISRGY